MNTLVLQIEVVIGSGHYVEGEGTAAGSATGGEVFIRTGAMDCDVGARRGRIVGTGAGTDVRFDLPEPNRIRKIYQKHARVNQVAAVGDLPVIQRHVRIGREAVVEHFFFQRETNGSAAKDVAEFYPAVATDVMIYVERDFVSIWEGAGAAPVEGLVNVGAAFQGGVPADAEIARRRNRSDLLHVGRSGEKRAANERAE